jgi:rhodanese-related sulfurtransferase
MNRFVTFVGRHWALSVLFVLLVIAIFVYEKFSKEGDASAITPEMAVQLMNREEAVVLDVRKKDAFVRGHVINSINIPFAMLEKDIKRLNEHKHKPIIVVCAQGVTAVKAAKLIQTSEFGNVRVLTGGLRAWTEAKLPLEKA